MATFTVTNTNDSGAGSLREAIGLANANADPDTIKFASALTGQTIALTTLRLDVSTDITIDGDVNGDDKADITISGSDAFQIFNITGGSTDVTLASLDLTKGRDSGSPGAAVACNGGTLTVVDSTISDNHAASNGGGIGVLSGTLAVVNSTISGNTAQSAGGGVYVAAGGQASFVNATIVDNSAKSGGGILALDPVNELTIRSSTIAGNSASESGGGLYSVSTVPISNSVIAGNTAPTDADVYGGAGLIYADHSYFGTTISGYTDKGGSINGGGNPLLGGLLDNGGTVLTLSPLDGSPLIGAGGNAGLPADSFDIDGDGDTTEPLPLDARGGTRVVGGTVDIGAVEQIVDETIGGTAAADTIVGGLGNDVLRGGAGGDTIDGGVGIDTADYSGSALGVSVNLNLAIPQISAGDAKDDVLTGIENIRGGGLADVLTGDFGDNVIDGRAGADILRGFGGDDLFYVDNMGDMVLETAGEGFDQVAARGDYTLGAGQDIEWLNTTNAGAVRNIDLKGNELAQTIVGNNGNNWLHDGGVGGGDRLWGGGGNDYYTVYNSTAIIVEGKGQGGFDRVAAGVNYTLGAGVQVESLRTTSQHAAYSINLTGNEFGQQIIGNDGNNRLDGKGGSDTIQTGLGNDTVVFSAALDGSADTITDFIVSDDQIALDDFVFTALGVGALDASAFKDVALAPMDADDRIIYNSNTGSLFYDADGLGGAAEVKFASVSIGISLTAADFVVI
ncbi:calcium-binding protein [Mesorhizobium sp. LHD-90]|uniref:beta strand repeat-containing protein n=1 Tax=Mesorhizobium sp. LHD-90 TaxID=3071414 RepID=UPI0027E10D62|nr:calcium-binding protein [Mesorhizobium sp. LHD-90]MDQ6435109.1 calcium-binding protein [Mesorhizobium sp. LHD-90]